MKPSELLEDLRKKGVVFSLHEGERLRLNTPEGLVTPELVREVKRLKPDLLKVLEAERVLRRQEVVQRVTTGLPLKRWLTDREFTERYLILVQAHRAGTISEEVKERGLVFLLEHWEREKTEVE